MSTTIHCIYASKASPGFQESDLPPLLEKSRINNAARGVTGMLLYIEGNFFQVLEGEEADVMAIYDRICLDDRHGRVTQIIREPVFERDFPDWTMGYARVDLDDVQRHTGENDFFTAATCVEQMNQGRARKLLSAFRQGRWRADQTGMHRAHSRVA
jgi:hypothetical protein